MNSIIVTPRATEKAFTLVNTKNTYVFDVPMTANKQQIINAITEQYGVEIVGIKTLVQSGKAIRYSRGKNRYPGTTYRKDSKKAYVTLAEGSSIQVFDQPTQVEEEKK